MKNLFSSLNLSQIITFVFGTVVVFVLEKFMPASDLRSTLLALNAQVMALLLVLVRKPSTEGGTTAVNLTKLNG